MRLIFAFILLCSIRVATAQITTSEVTVEATGDITSIFFKNRRTDFVPNRAKQENRGPGKRQCTIENQGPGFGTSVNAIDNYTLSNKS